MTNTRMSTINPVFKIIRIEFLKNESIKPTEGTRIQLFNA